MKKKTALCICLLLVVCMLSFTACGQSAKKEIKNEKTYADEIASMHLFDSDVADAMPQTIIYKLMTDHFAAPLPEGKTVKKAIFIGYDGFRADGLENIRDMENSGIMTLKAQGGLYHTFSGGVAGVSEQATSTAPSWMAMLTGGWGDYNGITDNSQMKNPNADTFLTIAAKNGHTASFTTSWREHTALSYRPDIVASIEQGLPVEYTHQPDDMGTYYQILRYVAKPAGTEKSPAEDPDAIFFTLEFTDHAGHDTGFGNQNPDYVQACKDADTCGYEILKTIAARSTYAQEDWLIVISTDHGGTKLSHGGQTPFERMTWLAVNRPLTVTDTEKNYALTKQP